MATTLIDDAQLQDAASRFLFDGRVSRIHAFGNGHINDTFVCDCICEDGSLRQYALQNINTHVFKQPEQVMENIQRVTDHLRGKLDGIDGSDPARETLSIVPTRDGGTFYRDGKFVWRSYTFITGAITHDVVHRPRQAYEAARAFGRFQCLLDDLPGERLHETIVAFHDTPARVEKLRVAIEGARVDRADRLAACEAELAFVMARAEGAGVVMEGLASGEIPERITHNDTKINNVLFDGVGGHACCVIDLDTVMPGSSLFDFGDMVRTFTGEFEENEPDLDKVVFIETRFEALVRGYLEEARGFLTEREIDLLVTSGMLITYEIGVRFLADFLEGDVYFKVKHEAENLDRARTQFRLVELLEERREQLEAIVAAYR